MVLVLGEAPAAGKDGLRSRLGSRMTAWFDGFMHTLRVFLRVQVTVQVNWFVDVHTVGCHGAARGWGGPRGAL